jgi:hypothetical protein
MLRRILGYARRRLGLDQLLEQNVRDARKQPRIPATVIARSALVMMLTRLGSFNALEQSRPSRFWLGSLGRAPPSADTMGRVCQMLDLDGLRTGGHGVYEKLKRGKALAPPPHGLTMALLDAHESHATFRRHCSGCLKRMIHAKEADRVQYYHRHVTLTLVSQSQHLLLDAEPILPGEDEVAAATRLFDRVVAAYPRAFDLVGGDALYAQGPFFNHVRAAGKHVMAVLKSEQRDLMADAAALWEQMPPTAVFAGERRRECWDLTGLRTWPQCHSPVRVVRSHETWSVRRQLTKQSQEQVSDWVWVTTLPPELASTRTVVQLGHARWDIENRGFNELVSRWHGDHVYRHEATAMLVMCLLTMLAANLFAAFYRRDLKPALRAAFDTLHIARQMLAELMVAMPARPRAP